MAKTAATNKLTPENHLQIKEWVEQGKTARHILSLLKDEGVSITRQGLRSHLERNGLTPNTFDPSMKAFTKKFTPEVVEQLNEWLEMGLTAGDIFKKLLADGFEVTRQGLLNQLVRMGHEPEKLRERKHRRREGASFNDKSLNEFTHNHYDELEMKAELMQYSESMDAFRAQCWKKFKTKKLNVNNAGIHKWDLEFEDVYFPLICPVLGIKLDYSGRATTKYNNGNAPSFDRLDSNFGYVPGNVVVMSWRANRIKNDGTAEEHRAIADFLDSYHETKDDSLSLNELYEYDEEDEPTPEFVAEQARRAELPKEYKKCNCCGEYKALKQYVGEGVTYSTCIPCREQASYDQKGKKKSTNDFFLGVAWGNKATADFIKEFVATSKESSPSV
jgi:hypothetical protein